MKNISFISQLLEQCEPYDEIDSFVLRMENQYGLSENNIWYAFDIPLNHQNVQDVASFIFQLNPYCLEMNEIKERLAKSIENEQISFKMTKSKSYFKNNYNIQISLKNCTKEQMVSLIHMLMEYDELNGVPFHIGQTDREYLLFFESDLSYGIICEKYKV